MKALLLIGLAACHGGGDKPRSNRGSGVAPIEVVNQPQFPDAGGRASGASGDEIEPNDGDDVATPFPLDSTMRGKLDTETDVDHFRIDVDKPGALSLMVNAVDADLVVELEDGNGALVARSDRGGARVKEGIPNFGVVPGRYTAVVKAAVKRKVRPAKGKAPAPADKPGVVYELTCALVAIAPNAEHEPDEDRGTANDLIVGDVGSGYIGWSGDVDVWKLSVETLSAKNSVDIEVTAIEGVALELVVEDGIGNPVLSRKAPRGSPLIVRGFVPKVPASSPPFHYLTIKGAGSNPETAYTVKVTQQIPQTDAEIEPNDSVDKPFAMPADRTVVHARWSPGDVDCFGLAASGTITADVNPGSDFDPIVELFVDGRSLAIANKTKKGGEEKVQGLVAAGSKATVCVKSADPNATGEAAYDVTIQDDAP
ncbi:MAG TPA: hypothetical protein VF403_01595, partial [Kofleriaceae bacterium]